MRIRSVVALPVRIPPVRATPRPDGDGETSSSHTVILIKTDEGITGVGEAFRFAPKTMAAFVEEILSPMLVGQDPARIELLWDKMYRTTFRYGRMGLVMHAISGVEVALWDIAGKVAGKRVCDLLGGACRDGLMAYASMHPYDTPETTAAAAVSYLDIGFKALKLHQKDIASVIAVREAIGPNVRLMLDASGAWSQPDAMRNVEALSDCNLYWIEEPLKDMDDLDGLRRLRAHSSTRIAAGENEYTHYGFRHMVASSVVDVVQPDVIKAGGISATRKIIGMAEAYNTEICLHSFCFGAGVAAALHVGVTSPRCEMIEINAIDLQRWLTEPNLRPVDGMLALPEGPGLGISIPEDIVAGAYGF